MYFTDWSHDLEILYLRHSRNNFPHSGSLHGKDRQIRGRELPFDGSVSAVAVNENGLFDQDTVIYGIPMGAPDKTEPARCRYEVCTPLPGYQVSARGSIQCWTLPGGSFLIFQIPHTAGAVQTAWSLCFSELERLGYPLDKSRPVMERYKKRMVDRHRCELCVPVQSPPRHRAGRI